MYATPRPSRAPITVLDGPVGTELAARGVPTPLPGWSVHAIRNHPEVLAAIHRDHALAGATVHTANTFRTRPATAGPAWRTLAVQAVRICRDAVPPHHRVAGSIAPVEDCYRPDLSPPDAARHHRELAACLAPHCDLLLCETFPHPDEALAAVQAAVATGTETWLALTAGPDADLMSPTAMAEAGRRAVDAGAAAVLVNCVAASRTLPYVEALVAALGDVPVGAYANAGHPDERMGWRAAPDAASHYAAHARRWVDAGATLVGGCCGTGPEHIRAIAALVG